MTEQEWNAATEPTPMLEFLRGKASDRKLRLFTVACCRRVWDQLTDEAGHKAIEASEQFADDKVTADEFTLAAEVVRNRRCELEAYDWSVADIAEIRLSHALDAVETTMDVSRWFQECGIIVCRSLDWSLRADGTEYPAHCYIIHCVYGNPFRQVAFNPQWRTSTVLALAEVIYQDRAFERLPILADALQDADCDSDDILSHMRGGGEHYRGCWALDLALGKE
jgi:hypothetical protein